jgi:hypothetical protein
VLIKVNLVGQSIKVFTKRVVKHPWLKQTYRRTQLWAFDQAKAWIQHSRANHQVYRLRLLSENLIEMTTMQLHDVNVALG